MTAMKTRIKSQFFDNGSDFTLQVKLDIPMEAYPWKFNNSSNRGAGMGGMGGGPAGDAASRSVRTRRRRVSGE